MSDSLTRNGSVFWGTDQPRYYYDAAAVAEQANTAGRSYTFTTPYKTEGRNFGNPGVGNEGNGKYLSYDTRNLRSVWTLSPDNYSGAHFATFPREIPRRCILASTRPGDVVLDPFMGAGTTAIVARQLGRAYVGIELNPDYVTLANERLADPKHAQLDLFACSGVAA